MCGTVRTHRRQVTMIRAMQDLNPIPFPIVVANCVAWVGYSIVTKDPYVFLANDPGVLLGLFYTLSAYGFADAKVSCQILVMLQHITCNPPPPKHVTVCLRMHHNLALAFWETQCTTVINDCTLPDDCCMIILHGFQHECLLATAEFAGTSCAPFQAGVQFPGASAARRHNCDSDAVLVPLLHWDFSQPCTETAFG